LREKSATEYADCCLFLASGVKLLLLVSVKEQEQEYENEEQYFAVVSCGL